MANYKTFEEMEVWQDSIELCKMIYTVSNQGEFAKDFGFKDQIRRSAVSIPSNISEGFERESTKQFVYFLNVAKGSCGELRAQIRIALELGYFTQEEYTLRNEKCISVSRQIKGLSKYLVEKSKK